MTQDSFSSFVDTFLAKGVGLGTILAIAIGIFVWHRSGSPFLILRALLARFMGVKADSSSVLGRFSNEHEQLLAFRIKTGMRDVRTTKHAQQVIKWAKDHDENIEDVVGCGPFFNYARIDLDKKLPKKWVGNTSMLLAAIFLTLTALAVPFIVTDAAVITINKSSDWFLLRKDEFKPLNGEPIPIRECKSNLADLAKNRGLLIDDVEVICKFTDDPKYPGYVDKVVRDQHITFPIPAIVFAVMLIIFFRFGRQLSMAHTMTGRIEAKPVPSAKRKSAPRARSAAKKTIPSARPASKTQKTSTARPRKPKGNSPP